MSSYSPERKAALIRKILPPQNLAAAELSRQEGISQATLHAWRMGSMALGSMTLTPLITPLILKGFVNEPPLILVGAI